MNMLLLSLGATLGPLLAPQPGTNVVVQAFSCDANLVYIGTVAERHAFEEDGRVKTNVVMDVDRTIVDETSAISDDRYTLKIDGGHYQGRRVQVGGTPQMDPGDQYLVVIAIRSWDKGPVTAALSGWKYIPPDFELPPEHALRQLWENNCVP